MLLNKRIDNMNNIEPLPVTVQKTIGKPTFDSSENIRKGKFRLEFSDITNRIEKLCHAVALVSTKLLPSDKLINQVPSRTLSDKINGVVF